MNFIKQLFTWWNRQTLGTFIHTLLFGKFIGKDQFGNKYYSNSKGKRWVIYKDLVESSKIPPEWHLWIHSLKDNIPQENLTGTSKAHKPEGSLSNDSKKNNKKYETWKL